MKSRPTDFHSSPVATAILRVCLYVSLHRDNRMTRRVFFRKACFDMLAAGTASFDRFPPFNVVSLTP